MNKSILYLSICGLAACGAAYMSHSFQEERNEELVRNAKYKAIPNSLSAMMMKPVMPPEKRAKSDDLQAGRPSAPKATNPEHVQQDEKAAVATAGDEDGSDASRKLANPNVTDQSSETSDAANPPKAVKRIKAGHAKSPRERQASQSK